MHFEELRETQICCLQVGESGRAVKKAQIVRMERIIVVRMTSEATFHVIERFTHRSCYASNFARASSFE